MSVNSITSATTNYNSTTTYTEKTTAKEDAAKTTETEKSAVYEKSDNSSSSTLYSINKKSSTERSAIVEQMKADSEARRSNLINIVKNMMGKQASASSIASGKDEDAMWKFLASGNYTVDESTRLQAQKDIGEDGYWGVKQTSQRLFDFASALAGDDVGKMKEMQEAMMKGFRQATGAWGKELPGICQDTINAANKLFDDYYASK